MIVVTAIVTAIAAATEEIVAGLKGEDLTIMSLETTDGTIAEEVATISTATTVEIDSTAVAAGTTCRGTEEAEAVRTT